MDIKASDLANKMNVRADQKCTGHIPLCLTSSAGFALRQNVHCDDVNGRRFHASIKRHVAIAGKAQNVWQGRNLAEVFTYTDYDFPSRHETSRGQT